MTKKFIVMIILMTLVSAVLLTADTGLKKQAVSVPFEQLSSPASRVACTMTKFNGTPAGAYSGFVAGERIVTYYDPAVLCGAPAYPMELTAFYFPLFTGTSGVWPVTVDIVVFGQADPTDPCAGPGAELCRFQIVCQEADFAYPNVGTAVFPAPCCINGPVFVGIEYISPGPFPSVVFDNNPAPVTCDLWDYYSQVWYEWYNAWNPPVPGYPIFWVDGKTNATDCGGCGWVAGDPFKMHYPQLPDETGWDVYATMPDFMADDWQCSETGWVKDIHFWGSWKDNIIGEISNFIVRIHSDLPVGHPNNPNPYSMPGEILWERPITNFVAEPILGTAMEGWYNPATGEVLYNNHQQYFQYNICLPSQDWFWQDAGTIYWLSISAMVSGPQTAQWGWKSSLNHWNDDATWTDPTGLGWQELWEPGEVLSNPFNIIIDPMGNFAGGGGGGAYGSGWYFYPMEAWWNIWFYDHPLDLDRRKIGRIEFDIFPMDPGMPQSFELAVNWSTDLWTIEGRPPLPGDDELLFIGRKTLIGFQGEIIPGHYVLNYVIPDYNPEWVSVDVRGFNFQIPTGIITHICQGSMDLSFVITGGVELGACCLPSGLCVQTDVNTCMQQSGIYQGDGSVCLGDINPPNGVDDACEGIIPTGACCYGDGTCLTTTSAYCASTQGTYQGDGTACEGDINPVNGIDDACENGPFGACCLPGGGCVQVEAAECLNRGGTYNGDATTCLGDVNPPNGIDDACEVPEDLKWNQPPDLAPTGMDVNATMPMILADDFLCTQSGPIKEIHIWGSWLNDIMPGGPANVAFRLSIHHDIPAGVQQPYSMPGPVIWLGNYGPGQYLVRPYAIELVEGWYDPAQQLYLPFGDTQCWEYIFQIPEGELIQEGTPNLPIVYWLDVQAINMTGEGTFGWKTSRVHWNDDAVWGMGEEPYMGPWNELRYPELHPFHPQSIDLAFAIYGGQICDCTPGDATGDGIINILDIVYLIDFKFKGGPAPAPYPLCQGDPNCDCVVNILDIVYLIDFKFKGGPAPCTCLDWVNSCGWPLRK